MVRVAWSAGLVLALLLSRPAAVAPEVSIPFLDAWQNHMTTFAQKHCATLGQGGQTFDEQLAATYYDMTRVMYQVSDYTGSSTWNACAIAARGIYRARYVIPHGGNIQGYWSFATGLRMDWQRTRDALSQNAVVMLSTTMYASDAFPLEWTQGLDRTREVAYATMALIEAEAVGQPRRQRRVDLVNQAYGHMNQWFVTFNWRTPLPDGTLPQFSPFMVGLTAHSLIRDWEQTHDSRLVPALQLAADWLWANAWEPAKQAMVYDLNQIPRNPQPDLNLLIAPMYAFLYKMTGDTRYRDRGDQLFAGGVQFAFLDGAKQFNQNYWWSFDYVLWRQGVAPPPNPAPSKPEMLTVGMSNPRAIGMPGKSLKISDAVRGDGAASLDPTMTPSGPHIALAGGDWKKVVAEDDEANTCRVAQTTVTIS
jgi:hypothetical protein